MEPQHFMHIDPLKQPKSLEEFVNTHRLPGDIQTLLHNHYGYILNGDFLNAKKIKQAVKLLNSLGPDQQTATIELLNRYGISHDLSLTRTAQLTSGDTYIFWALETAAFILLNAYIDANNPDLLPLISTCLHNGQLYKMQWLSRDAQRKGGKKAQQDANAKRMFVFELLNRNPDILKLTKPHEQYKATKQLYTTEGGIKRFGDFYAPNSFTRNDKNNILTKFAQWQDEQRHQENREPQRP